jgi:tetratricopeptide (TPR) repeat protein
MKVLEKWWFWFALSFITYANTLNHDYMIDDLIVVTSNKMTQEGISGIPELFKHSYLFGYDGREDESYRPVTLASFAIEKSFFDAKPSASHFVQVLLYGLCMIVVFKFLSRLFGEEKRKLVYAILLLFVLHPIHTEVVANVKSRDELLAALFLFASLNHFAKWIREQKVLQLLLSLSLFFLATLSKETAVLGVLLFPATYYFMEQTNFVKLVKHSVVFILPFGLYFMIRSMVLSDVLIQDPIDPVANSLALASSNSELLASNFAIFSKYIQLTIFPWSMSWDYSVSTLPLVGFGSLASIIGVLAALILIYFASIGFFKKKMVGFGALIFISTFLLTSNFLFLINCPLGERFLFIPVLGIIIIVVSLLDEVLKKLPKSSGIIAVIVVSAVFLGRTIMRNGDWKDNLSIYLAGVEVCPNSVKTHFNLGTEYLVRGNQSSNEIDRKAYYLQAIDELKTAKKVYPKYANIYENIGYVYAELGKKGATKEETISNFKAGLLELNYAIDSLKLEKASLFQNKFFILEQLIKFSDSEKEKEQLMYEMIRTVELKKDKTVEEIQREIYYLRLVHEDDKLVKIAKVLIQKYPEKKDYLLDLSKEFFEQQKIEKSLEIMTLYVDRFPEDLSAKSNKGMLLEMQGSKKEAFKIYEDILAKDPNQTHTRELYTKLKQSI